MLDIGWVKKRPKLFSEEAIKKLSETSKGKLNGSWKGGITPLTKLIRHLFEYRQWRSDVFTRDNFTCQTCGVKSGKGIQVYLEAHHIKRFADIIEEYKIKNIEEAKRCEELWNINNGLTLCKKCHDKTKWKKKNKH